MKPFFVTVLLLISVLGTSGPRFDVYEWDFGRIMEADGAVSHTFVLLNDSSSPVSISRTIPGCSCIMASFSQETIEPGQIGEVEVFYSPSGASGATYRTIEFVAAGGKSLGTITVRADVVPADRSIQERYPFTISDLVYISRNNVPFGYVGHGKTLSKVIYLANAANETKDLEATSSDSPYFSVTCPTTVGPGEEVPVLLTWTMPSDPGFFATCRDTVYLSVDGWSATMPVAVSAICTDVASGSPDAPLLRTTPSLAPLKKGFLSRKWSGTITLENAGKSDLEILEVETPEGVAVNLTAGTKLPAGVKMELKAESTAPDEFRVNLFTNDPIHPYKELIYKQ